MENRIYDLYVGDLLMKGLITLLILYLILNALGN